MSGPFDRGIACCGHWVFDRTKIIDRFPNENALARILEEAIGSGGSGFNTIINLARFDSQVPLKAVGVLGEDPEGDYIVRECSKYSNIDCRHLIRTSAERTAYTDVYCVPSTGSRTFFSSLGASRLLGPETIDIETLEASIFHLGYLSLLEAFDAEDEEFGRVSARFLRTLQQKGMRTSLDMISIERENFADLVVPALRYTDYLVLNDYEAERLTGRSVRINGKPDRVQLDKVSDHLLNAGVHRFVAVHFPEGAYLRTREGEVVIQSAFAIPEEEIAGPTGAGDSFCAGLLYGLYKGFSLSESLEFATCAGALNLQHVTSTGAIRDCQSVWQIKKQYPLKLDWSRSRSS